jgi:hypothetical protein
MVVLIKVLVDTHATGCKTQQLNQLTELESFLRIRQFLSYSRISEHFIEAEGSLQYLQVYSTGPYPEPDQSSR